MKVSYEISMKYISAINLDSLLSLYNYSYQMYLERIFQWRRKQIEKGRG